MRGLLGLRKGELPRLSSADAGFVYQELEHPTCTSHFCVVVDGESEAPDFGVLRRRIGERIGNTPILQRHVERSPLGLLRPAWVRSNSPELVRFFPSADDDTLDDVLVEELERRVDWARRPWRLSVVAGRTRYRIVFSVHHALMDGAMAADTIRRLLADDAALLALKQGRSISNPRTVGPGDQGRLWEKAKRLSKADPKVPTRKRKGNSFWHTIVGVWNFSRATMPSISTPLNEGPSAKRAFRYFEIPRSRLKALHRTMRITTAEIVVAAGACAMERAGVSGASEEEVRACVPVQLNPSAEDGNNTTILIVPLYKSTELQAQLKVMPGRLRLARQQGQGVGAAALSRLDVLLPERLGRRTAPLANGMYEVLTSYLPAPAPFPILGSPIRCVWGLGPIPPRHPLSVEASTSGKYLSFGVCLDPEVGAARRFADELGGVVDELTRWGE